MYKKNKNLIINSVLAVIAVVTVFYAGYIIGSDQPPRQIEVIGVPNTEGKYDDINFNLFWEAWDLVRDKHLKGEDIDNQKLLYGAIAGLLESTDDPYSVFFEPEDSQKFQEDVEGHFGGVGMEIEVRDKRLLVVSPLNGTPAYEAGVKAGDQIIFINDDNTFDLGVEEAVKKIRGEIGTKVKLTIFREGFDKPEDFNITRANIEVPTLEWEMLEGDIAYIKLMSFNSNSLPLFYEAIIKSSFSGAQGLVLDLRNNPGGFLEVATRLAGWFIDDDAVIVSEKFRSGETKDFKAPGNGILKNMPTVILINKGSASASEILAGALRDLRDTKLIGETTFGKGTVQELQSLSDGSLVKLTTAHWVLPNGGIIDEEGIAPDFEVKEDEKAQLDKAIEVLKSEINK